LCDIRVNGLATLISNAVFMRGRSSLDLGKSEEIQRRRSIDIALVNPALFTCAGRNGSRNSSRLERPQSVELVSTRLAALDNVGNGSIDGPKKKLWKPGRHPKL